MTSDAFAQKLPERYRAPPTEEQLAILQLRRKLAVSNPLQSDQSLELKSYNFHPESTALIGQSKSALCTSPNPLRPLNERLLRALEEAGAASSLLKLRLVKELQGKEEKWSQVWLCDVEVVNEVVGEVVVKFLAESLFPYPEDTWWEPRVYRWMSGSEIARREARAYAAFRDLAQGIDVPWCYGFYRFDMPWGEEVTGILLEDLSDPSQAQTVETCIQACRPKTVEPDIENFDSLVLSIFLTQQRLQNLGIVSFWSSTSDIILLSTQDSNGIPHTVFLDFGETRTREEKAAERGPFGFSPEPDSDVSDSDRSQRSVKVTFEHHPLEWRKGDEHRLAVRLKLSSMPNREMVDLLRRKGDEESLEGFSPSYTSLPTSNLLYDPPKMSTESTEAAQPLSSLSLNEVTEDSDLPATTLLSLPDELLQAIFDHLDGFILPPLNRRLLPFHRAQLFKTVVIAEKERLLGLVELLETEKSLKDSIVAIFLIEQEEDQRSNGNLLLSGISKIVRDLVKLQQVVIRGSPKFLATVVPDASWFEGKSKMLLQIGLPPRASDPGPGNQNFSSGMLGLESEYWMILIRNQALSDTFSFVVRGPAFALDSVRKVLTSLPIGDIFVDNITPTFHPPQFLTDTIAFPLALRRLTIFGFFSPIFHQHGFSLSNFPNLTYLRLALFSFSCPQCPSFLQLLDGLSLQQLSIAPETEVTTAEVLEYVGSRYQRPTQTLEELVVSNYPFEVPQSGSPLEADFRIEWNERHKMEELVKIRDLSRRMGIEISGKSFEALRIAESDEYRELVAREEEEAAWTDVEDEDDE
ncbi:hypothetical protein JCM5350_005571 [Sporobolomyces pararoseus]